MIDYNLNREKNECPFKIVIETFDQGKYMKCAVRKGAASSAYNGLERERPVRKLC